MTSFLRSGASALFEIPSAGGRAIEGSYTMTNSANPRRRPSVHISLPRAARLHRLVCFLAENPRARSAILSDLKIGLRTFYRELDLLGRCGVKVRHKQKLYHLLPTAGEAEGRLPFPDPQLSFAEMAELSQCPCPAGARLAELLALVTKPPEPTKKRSGKAAKRKKTGS
jgi:hypothetical protein